MTKAEAYRLKWLQMEARTPKFLDAVPRSPDDAFRESAEIVDFALKLNPSLIALGDGDLDEHVRMRRAITNQASNERR